MPPCRIDHRGSPTFIFLVEKYKKRFPHIEQDFATALSDIRQDFRTARHARALLHFNSLVYKYRVPCSDQNRGTKGGYRLIAYFRQENNTLYPISLYPKSEQDDIEDAEVERCVAELLEALSKTS